MREIEFFEEEIKTVRERERGRERLKSWFSLENEEGGEHLGKPTSIHLHNIQPTDFNRHPHMT